MRGMIMLQRREEERKTRHGKKLRGCYLEDNNV